MLQIKGYFFIPDYVLREVTTCVIICHYVTYNPLFYNMINRHNFAPTTERIPLRRIPEAEE